MSTPDVREVSPFTLNGGDVLADTGDYVLQVSWGKSRTRAVVVEIQRPDNTTGRRYFADDAVVSVRA